MSISRLINENATISATVSVMGIIGAFVWMVHGSTRIEPQYYYGYFYDMDQGALFVDVRTKAAPIETPEGGERGMLAAVFSCGACEDKSTHFIAWIERYSPEGRRPALMAERAGEANLDGTDHAEAIAKGHQIALVPEDGSEPKWLPASSTDAAHILSAAMDRCGRNAGSRAQACNPVADDLP